MSRPSHHGPDGRFRAPWPEATGDDGLRRQIWRVALEATSTRLPDDPNPGDLPLATPRLAHPVTDRDEVRLTWVGHATFLLQLPGLNLLTDPVWSTRASPVPLPLIARARFVPAVPDLDALPPIHGVLLSHDHYDHLDRPTIRRLHDRYGDGLRWYVPLGLERWLGQLGIEAVTAADWWDEVDSPEGGYTLIAAPARHWCRRTPWDTNRRLWCSWAIRSAQARAPNIYFGGDTAYASFFGEVGRRLGPFDACLLPIGAYEPRWFMRASHTNPEEAVRIYRDLGGRGVFVPMHWGTFRLTFEDPLEPPRRLLRAWAEAGLPDQDLEVLRHGETLVLRSSG